jgi:hypothetical protein
MSRRDRIASAAEIKRPFVPALGHTDPQDDLADALDHIARAISAIDHNLENLTTSVGAIAVQMPKLLQKL